MELDKIESWAKYQGGQLKPDNNMDKEDLLIFIEYGTSYQTQVRVKRTRMIVLSEDK